MHSMGVHMYILCVMTVFTCGVYTCGVEIICMYRNHMNCILYTYISVILSTVVEIYILYVYLCIHDHYVQYI